MWITSGAVGDELSLSSCLSLCLPFSISVCLLSVSSLHPFLVFRYKDIAGHLEKTINEGLQAAPGWFIVFHHEHQFFMNLAALTVCVAAGSMFHLQVSEVLWSCLMRCWSDGVYLPPLAHRLWKMTLQLLARYAKFLDEVTLHTPTDKSIVCFGT